MIKIVVESLDVQSRKVTTKKGEQTLREQTIYAYLLGKDGKPEPHPTRSRHTLWPDDQPLAVGTYTLAPASIYTDRFGGLALSPKFVPVAATGRGGA